MMACFVFIPVAHLMCVYIWIRVYWTGLQYMFQTMQQKTEEKTQISITTGIMQV